MTDVAQEIRHRIIERGPISFAQFMELALYSAAGGYYGLAPAAGTHGDFYTAPVTHPLFGALLALQLRQMWRRLGRPFPFWVVEPGAGSGRLGQDILSFSRSLGRPFATALQYLSVDRALSRHTKPADKLNNTPHHQAIASGLPVRPFVGCVLANELLDSMPVHRVTTQGGRLKEIYVGVDEAGRFREVVGETSTPALEERFRELGITLPEGYRAEVNLHLGPWLEEAAGALEQGFILVVDYGHPAEALYAPERSRGTLRCYYKHTLNANPYQHVGQQDISVHVDFTTLTRKAIQLGLKVYGPVSQRDFLFNLGFSAFITALERMPLEARGCSETRSGGVQRGPSPPLTGVWGWPPEIFLSPSPARRERGTQGVRVFRIASRVRQANRMAMQELVKPEGMGAFKVVALGKGVRRLPLHGFSPSNPLCRGLEARPERLKVPLATPQHMPFGPLRQEQVEMPKWEEMWR